jgi:hypothetical protein
MGRECKDWMELSVVVPLSQFLAKKFLEVFFNISVRKTVCGLKLVLFPMCDSEIALLLYF